MKIQEGGGINNFRIQKARGAEHFGIKKRQGGIKILEPSVVGYGYFLESFNIHVHKLLM